MKLPNKKHRPFLILAASLVGGCLFWIFRAPQQLPPVERIWPVMGTFASITLRGDDAEHIEETRNEMAAILDAVNTQMSVYLPDSEISKLNASTNSIAISALSHEMLLQARYYALLTDGAFDPTAMPIIHLWGFSGGHTPDVIPSETMISEAQRLTGIDKLIIESDSAHFCKSGMTLDLGGIAKGFAVDQSYEAIITKLPINALFNLGGNIRCHGSATPDRPWRIGVQHPFEKGQTLGILTLESGMAVATSGNYERFVTINGKRYAHIINPKTGWPVEGMAGVTVLSTTATEADAMSTALFVLGINQAGAILEKCPTSQALLVPDRQPIEIYISPGFENVFVPNTKFANCVKRLSINR